MNSEKFSLNRPIGQRSITSTFIFRTSDRSSNCEKNVEIKGPSLKGSTSNLSLSDFLNRNLHRSSVLPSSVQGKTLPFSLPSKCNDLKRDAGGSAKMKEGEAVTKFSIDGVFDMFKKVEKDKADENTLHQTKKRKTLLGGDDDKTSGGKRLAVLGEDSKPMQSTRRKTFAREESRPVFNHYENGGGWWDDKMAGVDNEEVGCSDVWEGVGCTTLGGIEWH